MYEYFKNHSYHGFIEPIYAFVPSIAINQIIKVPDNFSEYWKNNFLVTSLAGRQIQRILFDKNFTKLIFNEKIYIGSRIRDIYYIKEFNVFLLALEGDASPGGNQIPSIGILSNSLNNRIQLRFLSSFGQLSINFDPLKSYNSTQLTHKEIGCSISS